MTVLSEMAGVCCSSEFHIFLLLRSWKIREHRKFSRLIKIFKSLSCSHSFVRPPRQDLKGKILLKAKKIGGLEESFNGMVEDSMTGEVSDEDEAAEIDEDNLHRESVRRRIKVGRVV